MDSREIVLRAITFDNPERVAMTLPEPYPNDICTAGATADPRHRGTEWAQRPSGGWEHTDEWGNTWQRLEGISKGEVARGVLEDWDLLDKVELPDYDLPERYERARRRFAEHADKFHVGTIPGFPFNIARKMRRLDNFLMDVVLDPDRCERLLAMVEEQMHHAIRHLAGVGADCIFFAEDWGTQDRLLVSPTVWRRMFKPGFERLCATAHERGLFVFIHTCGYVYEVMDDMIEAGIDVFQFDQPSLYGIDRLAREFGGRATFWCPVDIQATLQTRDAAGIEEEARRMVELLGAKGGGFIAGYYGSNEALGLDPKWQDIACRAFVRYGAPEAWQALRSQR